MSENEISSEVIRAAIEVHKILGPGLLESTYRECLFYELYNKEFMVLKEHVLPVIYKDVQLDLGYRVDFLIDNKVIIEIKAVESLNDIHLAQAITYLKLSGCKLGLLINFNVKLLKQGIKRVVYNLCE
jgi:GxxExxY protein